ncbi:MAG: TatD family hydrolase [Burkholderiaceae bacterium]
MLIDTHCHLDAAEFDADRLDEAHAARTAGVRAIVIPAVAVDNFDHVRQLAHQVDGAYALGIHPLFVERSTPDDLVALRRLVEQSIGDPRLVAIGEIGLDHFVPDADRERQMLFYREQLKIARDHDLSVLLHVRRAQDPVLAQLRRFGVRQGIAHAFNGSRQQADAYLGQGLALGFGGAMTFARALQIRRLAAELPDDAHVLETDAPDIAPAWQPRERNSPTQLPRIAQVFAELRETTPEEVARRTGENAVRVLPRLGALLRA